MQYSEGKTVNLRSNRTLGQTRESEIRVRDKSVRQRDRANVGDNGGAKEEGEEEG